MIAPPIFLDVFFPEATVYPGTWTVLADAAENFADGHLYLSSTGQLRFNNVSDLEALAATVRDVLDRRDDSPVDCPVGWHPQENGQVNLGAGLRLGKLEGQVARMLDVIECDVKLGNHRLLLCDLDEAIAEQVVRVLAPLGFIFDDKSPWLKVSTCASCSLSLSDVHGDAAQAVSSGLPEAGPRVHFIGCTHSCGQPAFSHIEYEATGDGEYEVTQR